MTETDEQGDRELRVAFAALRADDARRAPELTSLLAAAHEGPAARGRPRRRPDGLPTLTPRALAPRALAWGAGGALLAAAALAGLLLLPPGGRDAAFEEAVRSWSAGAGGAGWRSPTARLLDVPGSELLRTVPTLGGVQAPSSPRPIPDPG